MNEREQGEVLHQITQEHGISQNDLAKRIGKSRQWVDNRIKLALNLAEDIVKALENDIITMRVAEIISTLVPQGQPTFLKYLIANGIERNETEVRKAKKRFLNNTIYTVGYEGKELPAFIECLKNNEIEYLIDLRIILEVDAPLQAAFLQHIIAKNIERNESEARGAGNGSLKSNCKYIRLILSRSARFYWAG